MKRLFESIIFLAFIILNSNVFGQNKEIDSLRKEYAISKNDTLKAIICFDMGYIHRAENLDSAIYYYSKSLNIADRYLKTATSLSDKKNALKIKAISYQSRGNTERVMGDFENAMKHLIEALKISEGISDRISMAKCYTDIGTIYGDQENLDKALEFFVKSSEIKEELKDGEGLIKCYLNIGTIYYFKNSYNEALRFYQKALKIGEGLNSNQGLVICYISIGNLYKMMGQYEKAIDCSKKALKIVRKIGDKNRIIDVYSGVASLNVFLADSVAKNQSEREVYLKEALYYGLEGHRIAHETGALFQENNCSSTLVDTYKRLGDYKKALEYAELSLSAKDTLFNEEKTREINGLQLTYEREKNIKEKVLLEKDKTISQEKAQKQKVIIISISTGFILLVFMTTFILRRLQITRNQKAIIEEKGILLSEQNEEISAQRDNLEILNEELSQKNEEILAQSEEIATQRDNLELMNVEIQLQHDQISHQHNEITASINYASRIQEAMLPSQEIITKHFPDFFVMYRPCQIVSGDFYWFKQFKNIMYIVAADCTGHGIPGAFMSMLGLSLLNDTIGPRDVNPPHESLNELRKRLKKTLHQTGLWGEQQDGMDLAMCMVDLETNIVQFSGAYNPMYLVRNNEIVIHKGDRMPIGVHPKDTESFTTKEIQLQPNDCFYIFSDGYTSQIGGTNAKKFKSSMFQEMLLGIKNKPMVEQKSILENTFDEWKGHHDQVDDILVIGVRV